MAAPVFAGRPMLMRTFGFNDFERTHEVYEMSSVPSPFILLMAARALHCGVL